MLQTKRSHKQLKGSNERLMTITQELERIQQEGLRVWAFAEINQVRSQELRENLDELLSKQEENLKRLVTLSNRDESIERLEAVSRD